MKDSKQRLGVNDVFRVFMFLWRVFPFVYAFERDKNIVPLLTDLVIETSLRLSKSMLAVTNE